MTSRAQNVTTVAATGEDAQSYRYQLLISPWSAGTSEGSPFRASLASSPRRSSPGFRFTANDITAGGVPGPVPASESSADDPKRSAPPPGASARADAGAESTIPPGHPTADAAAFNTMQRLLNGGTNFFFGLEHAFRQGWKKSRAPRFAGAASHVTVGRATKTLGVR